MRSWRRLGAAAESVGRRTSWEVLMDFNAFVHQEGLTAEREAFWRFVRGTLGIEGDADKDEWWQWLGQFEEQKPVEVQ